MSRDPIGEEGGVSLYACCSGDAINHIDLQGHYALAHGSLTKQSFEDATPFLHPTPSKSCREKMLSALLGANLGQDKGFAQDQLERHFNRPPEGQDLLRDSRSRWRDYYTCYLQTETDALGSALLRGKDPTNCDRALETLGRLSHSWQDFFGHSIHAKLGFWIQGPFTATPHEPGDFWPSSYPGEHPPAGEPVVPGNPAYRPRYDAARRFVALKFASYLSVWLGQCRCSCEEQ